MMKCLLFFVAWSFTASASMTDLPKNEKIWSTAGQRWLTLQEWREKEMAPGDVLVLGEQHAVGETLSERVHHANQHRLMFELAQSHRVSLGMEFFEYPKQDFVDQYTSGNLAEADFLREIGWGGNAFPLYRDQVKIAGFSGGRTWGLNIPRAISGKVGRMGKDSLDTAERAIVPPLWERGSAPYFERFSEIMSGHTTPDQLENFFWAQCLWDDTMAWQTSLRHDNFSDEIFVIIVGEFHVQYGHALRARLVRHGVEHVKTMVQAEVADWEPATLVDAKAPDVKYGPRADYIWVYELPAK